MTFTEWWANSEIGKKKVIESKKNPVKNKESFVSVKKQSVKQESLKIKVENPIIKEIQKNFPRLSKAWIEKIALSYKKFDAKDAAKFFATITKYNTQNYPQSLVATSLIQYGKNVNDGKLSIANYEIYLQSLVAENDRLKTLYNTFSTKNDPAFADFKVFKEKYKWTPQTIDQISQWKWFTNETYIFFQYLSSSSFKANKTNIIGSLSLDDRKQFSQYLKSDVRIAQIVWVAPADVVKNTEILSDTQVQEKSKEWSFADAKNTFMNDATKEDWPKQIVEDVDQTVFGTEWLAGTEIQDIFIRFQKKFSKAQWESLIANYPQLIPAKMNKQKFIDYCMGIQVDKNTTQKRALIYHAVFENIVKKWLQPQTKEDIQEHVMDTYFEQVAWILKSWWEIVKTENITYNKDGTIEMKYSTPRGIQGIIHISPNGEVTILDMFAYRSENEKWDNQNIIEKMQHKLMDGRLPSMKEMMNRCSKDKWVIFDAWESHISWWNKTTIVEKEVLAPTLVTQDEENSRKILDLSMNKMLSMTQTADILWAVVEHTYKVLWLPQNDIYSKYVKWEIWFLDSKVHTQVEWLFTLRTDLLDNPGHIERFNNALLTLFQTYSWSSITKEKYPFWVLEWSSKETFFQFLSRFCISDKEFDITKFESCIQAIHATKPELPESFNDFYQNNTTLFPLKSLYLTRYPEEDLLAQKSKEQIPIINPTRKALNDLQSEIQLGIDFEKANIS